MRNTTGVTIPANSACYIVGTSGLNTLIALAEADIVGSYPAVGVVNSAIANNSNGIMIILGEILAFNTTGYADNDTLYLSETAGQLTNIRPSASTSAVQNLGRVVRGGVSNGIITVLGSGRANDVPNLDHLNVFIGNNSGVEQRQLDYTTDLLNLPDTLNSLSFTLPATDGTLDQVMTTDGAGQLSWADMTGGVGGEVHVVYDDITSPTYAAPKMLNRSGDSASFQFESDDQTYGGAYSATLNMTSWANLPSNNVHVLAYKSTAGQQLFNLTADGAADDGSHNMNFRLRGATGYLSTRDNSSPGGALTDMSFEGTQLDFFSDTAFNFNGQEINFNGLTNVNDNLNVNGSVTISDGVSEYTFPNTDGTVDQVMSTDGNGIVSWVDVSGGQTFAFTFPATDGTVDQVMSTDGAGQLSWVDVSGGGGGATQLDELTDVSLLNLENNDLLMYNSVASEWQNTNLGVSVTPILSGDATAISCSYLHCYNRQLCNI